MADHVMESRLWLARPRSDVFAFIADPSNLARVMPPTFDVRLLTPGVTMAAGAVLEFRIVWVGVPPRAAGRAAGAGQRAGRVIPSRSSRGRTRSLSRPMRARFCTIEECMSLRKYFRNGAKSLDAAVSRR